ncbi:MAG: 50S ribosomal protein L32 [Bacillota bacterium]|nr:50S ribosomal protein L32 [Bacillota bacterium]
MAVPKKKTSRSRRGMRRSHWHLPAATLVQCPRCHEPIVPHRACPACGYYAGRKVLELEEKKKRKKS